MFNSRMVPLNAIKMIRKYYISINYVVIQIFANRKMFTIH